jgi:hypothetical protein
LRCGFTLDTQLEKINIENNTMKKISQHSLMVLVVLVLMVSDIYIRINYSIELLWIIIGAILGAYWTKLHKLIFKEK